MTILESPRIGGVDLSLTSTGLARLDMTRPNPLNTWCCKTGKLRGHDRVTYILTAIFSYVGDCDLIAVEGLAFGAKGNALLDLAGLRAIVMRELWIKDLITVTIPPANLKKYATGNHQADKLAMYAAALDRLRPEGALIGVTHDEADAAWLAQMTGDKYGCPLAKMPQAQRATIDALHRDKRRRGQPVIDWPELPAQVPAA